MSPKRHPAILGMTFLVALALSAIAASTAVGASWGIQGKTLAGLGLKEETLTGSGGPLSLEVPARNMLLECKTVKGTGKIIETVAGEATLELSGCVTMSLMPAEPLPECVVIEPVVAEVVSELKEGEGGKIYAFLKAPPEKSIAVIQFEKEKACVFPINNPVKGEAAGELKPEEAAEQQLTFSKAISEAAKTKLTFAAFTAYLKGTLGWKLSGANAGDEWGFCVSGCSGISSYNPVEGYGASNPGTPGITPSCTGDPINCATGNLIETQTDIAIGGRGPALEVTRSYNSQLAATQKEPGTFGYGWTGPYSAHLTFNKETGTTTVHHDNGSAVIFYGEGLTPGAWVQSTLVKEGSNYLYTLPDQSSLEFNSSGQLTKVSDRHGNALTLTYKEGKLETVKDAGGRTLTFIHKEGKVESVKDPMGYVAKYTYESNDLASVTLSGKEAARWKFKYDGSHRLTELTDGRGNTTKNEYDGSHRVTLQTDALERKRKLEYKETEGIKETTITEPNTSKTLEKFNSAGQLLSITKASGTELAQTTTSKYDAAFNLIETTDANKNTTTFGYDAEGNRTSEKDPNGNEAKWTYNATRDVKTTTTPMGVTTTYVRNAAGDPETVERPAPGGGTQKWTFKYAKNGDLESETDPLSRTTTLEYNSYGDRKAETNPEGDKRTWAFNEDSQLVSEVSPRGNEEGAKASEFETKFERDPQGRLLTATNPLGHTTKRAYDGNGNLETMTDGNGRTTTYTYDSADQLTKVKAPNGDVREAGYDSMGLITSRTDGSKNTRKYERNLLGQITEEIDPLERKTTREYDAAGNLKKVKDPESRTITYTYDPADRLTKVDYSEEATADVVYEYDKNSNVTVMKDGTGTTGYELDSLDRLIKVENGAKQVVKYEYNLGEEQTKVTYPNGKSLTRAFDKAGRLEKITDWLSGESKFAYDRDSQLKATTFPSGSTNKDEYAYNNADQLTKITMKRGSETLASLSYARDKAGQVESETQTGLPGGAETSFAYDENERLSKAGASEFKYDAANNPTSVAGTSYSYDKASQLEKGGGVSFTFNKVGQRTKAAPESGPATTYGYDQAGNLISVKRPEEGAVKKIEDAYAYDGKGLRASQTISGAKAGFAWDASAPLPLLLSDGANSYIYGPGGLPIAQINGEEKITYLHHDQLGSTRLLTNSSGEAKGSYTYSPYGAVSGQTGSTTTPLGFNGQYTNSSTGLIYMRARTYDPVTAQFLSADPLVAKTGEPYSYAADDPVNEEDPSGEAPPRPTIRDGSWYAVEVAWRVVEYDSQIDCWTNRPSVVGSWTVDPLQWMPGRDARLRDASWTLPPGTATSWQGTSWRKTVPALRSGRIAYIEYRVIWSGRSEMTMPATPP